MGEKEEPLFSRRIESRNEVSQREGVFRRRDMVPALHYDRIGTLPEEAVEPVSHAFMRVGCRHSGPEADLGLDVLESGRPVELLRWPRFLPAGQGEGGKKSGGKGGKGGKGGPKASL
jgi:hypothetical protein